MAKFYGNIGFVKQVEKAPSVWVEDVTEKPYYGDILRNSLRWQSGDNQNDNISIENRFSIIADGYARENYGLIRYIEYGGIKWKVTSLSIDQYPRLELTVGGEYNGKK